MNIACQTDVRGGVIMEKAVTLGQILDIRRGEGDDVEKKAATTRVLALSEVTSAPHLPEQRNCSPKLGSLAFNFHTKLVHNDRPYCPGTLCQSHELR
jgi:hypothetical protein